jgi:integrase
MHDESSHDPRHRERVADNVYRRVTKTGRLVYEAKFRDADGRFRSRTLHATSERAAIREARALLARRDGGERLSPGSMTLSGFAADDFFPTLDGLAQAGRRSERGVALYRDKFRLHVEPVLGSRKLAAVETSHVAALIRGMRARGYSEATIAAALVVLRAIYRLARSRGHTKANPLDGLDPAELPRPTADHGRVLDEQELAALVRHAAAAYRGPVAVLAYSGLRLSEALGLRWADVDFVERELSVTGQLSLATRGRPARIVAPKTRASLRNVPLFPALERVLTERLAAELAAGRGQAGDFVFCTRRGQPLSQRNVAGRGVEAAAASAGLGRVTPQDLRRSFCSLAGRRGVDPVEAAAITGHSLATWTTHYARSFGKAQRDEARTRLLAHGFGADADTSADTALVEDSLTDVTMSENTWTDEDFGAMRPAGFEPATPGSASRCSIP